MDLDRGEGNGHARVESRLEVSSFLSDLRYRLNQGAKIHFQEQRMVDNDRNIRYTNAYTISDLFPDENPVEALRRELLTLSPENYIQTVKDMRFPKRSEMRAFGKVYNNSDVYIKVRTELLNLKFGGEHTMFVMSFHYAEYAFSDSDFPYKTSPII